MSSRERTRVQLVEVAARVLAAGGPEAVTTRAVALAAGVQAPTIYRLFGDKNGLLDAVVERGFASYVARKPPVEAHVDPVESLRAGWELHIGFGMENPWLFRLMHTALRTPEGRAIAARGTGILEARVHLVAEAGRLCVTEQRAADLIRAAGTGVVFTLIDRAGDEQDHLLADAAWEAVSAAILTDPHTASTPGPGAAAVPLRGALLAPAMLAPAERALFGDWLDRVAWSGVRPGTKG